MKPIKDMNVIMPRIFFPKDGNGNKDPCKSRQLPTQCLLVKNKTSLLWHIYRHCQCSHIIRLSLQ